MRGASVAEWSRSRITPALLTVPVAIRSGQAERRIADHALFRCAGPGRGSDQDNPGGDQRKQDISHWNFLRTFASCTLGSTGLLCSPDRADFQALPTPQFCANLLSLKRILVDAQGCPQAWR